MYHAVVDVSQAVWVKILKSLRKALNLSFTKRVYVMFLSWVVACTTVFHDMCDCTVLAAVVVSWTGVYNGPCCSLLGLRNSVGQGQKCNSLCL